MRVLGEFKPLCFFYKKILHAQKVQKVQKVKQANKNKKGRVFTRLKNI